MKNNLSIAKIILKMKTRDPLEFFWNLILPIIAFVFIFHADFGRILGNNDFLHRLIPFLSWVIFQSSVYGVGMVLLSWRESSFLKSLIYSNNQKSNLVFSLVLVQLFYTLFYTVGIYITGYFTFSTQFEFAHLLIFFPVLLFSCVFSLLSIVLNSMSFSYHNISTLLSIVILPFAWTAGKETSGALIQYLNLVNPMFYFNQFCFNFLGQGSNGWWIPQLVFLIIVVTIGVVGIKKLKIIAAVKR